MHRNVPRAVRAFVVAVVAVLSAVLLTPGAASAGGGATATLAVADRHGPRWSTLPPAPLPALDQVTGAWTGRLLVVVGEVSDGDGRLTSHAAAYDPARRAWRKLPPPRGARPAVEGSPTAVWTGRELIVVGGDLSEAYDPATNRWRHLNRPDGVAFGSQFAAVWTGRVLVVYGGGCCDSFEDTGAVYDPATDRWHRFTSPLLGKRMTSGVWTGREVVLAGGVGHDRRGARVELATAAAYNPVTGTWRRLPPMPARAAGPMVWDGSRAIVFGSTGAMAYSPARNSWTVLRGYDRRAEPAVVRAGNRLVVWGGSVPRRDGEYADVLTGLVYSRSRGWSKLPAAPVRGRSDAVVAWTGSRLLVLGGADLRHGAALIL
jgi:Kelch motif